MREKHGDGSILQLDKVRRMTADVRPDPVDCLWDLPRIRSVKRVQRGLRSGCGHRPEGAFHIRNKPEHFGIAKVLHRRFQRGPYVERLRQIGNLPKKLEDTTIRVPVKNLKQE